MIDRYALPEIAGLFTDEARFRAWLEVEILATEAWAKLGVVPAADAVAVRERADFTVEAILERERTTEHDVAAFVDVVQERIGAPAGSWLHYGLTSSDVVDTALSVVLVQAVDLVIEAAAALEVAITAQAHAYRTVAMAGRTHGVHAEPTTFGAKLALWAMQVHRDRERLARARAAIAVGKLSGAVGTYSNIDPAVEAYVCEALGLTPVPATQVIARDRHAELLYACASVGATIEAFATEIRHLQRTEVREVEEPFRAGAQKGSSAMPHKRNPVKAEQLSGLARVLRGNLQAGLENVALWHERDISHSSVERIILPDSLQLAYYVLVKFRSDRRGHARVSRADAGEPRRVVRARVQPAGAARAGRVGHDPRRRVPRGAAQRDDHVGVAPAVPRRAARRRRRRRRAGRRTPRRVLRPQRRARQRRPHVRRASTHAPDRSHRAGVVSKLSLPHHYTGKVRELYEVDHDRMLVVASDRVSVFDVVLPDLIPDKGRVLTALSTFWFEQTAHLAPNHLVSSDPTDFPETAGPEVAGRAMLVQAARPVRLECVARGYLFGSAWSDYQETGTVMGRTLPAGLRQAERLPEPIFTPTTKADEGHDLPLDRRRRRRARGRRALRGAPRPHARDLRVRRRARRRATG